jgi:hypothetical protein
MSQHDDDLDFEFFDDEPDTEEAASTQRRRMPLARPQQRPPGGGGPPRRSGGIAPLLRLVGLIAFAILIVVLLVFWIQSCQGSSKHSEFESYMTDVSQTASDSQSIGKEFARLLTTPGLKEDDLESRLNGLAQRQRQIVARAEDLAPPGQLRAEQRAAVEALQFRASGLSGLENAFRQTFDYQSGDEASALLALQAQRLLASDVVWDDLFKAPAKDVLQNEGITGVAVPDSTFLASPDLASSAALKPIWERIQGAAHGGSPTGLHGTGIQSTTAQPSGTELSQDTETTITVTPDLAFEVAVKDTGDSQEVEVQVNLTIQKTPTSIVKTETIPLINPGETKTVTFRDLGQPPFGQRTSVKVDVKPVPGESSTANNTAEYPVIFSLGT